MENKYPDKYIIDASELLRLLLDALFDFLLLVNVQATAELPK